MIRVISLRKAILAGAAGAIAWEIVLRLLALAGLPLVDIVHGLGLIALPAAAETWWWPAGMALHLLVGVIWAVFYAYFAWSTLPLRPVLQGLVFAVVPLGLALAVVYPQVAVMLSRERILDVSPWTLMAQVSSTERTGILVGHLIYGAVLGALYTRPVGYRAGHPPARPSTRRRRPPPPKVRRRDPNGFIFATGVECSYPTLEGGRWRRDLMASTGHYRHWPQDLDLCVELGVSHLRYGPPLHLAAPASGRFDWSFADQVMEGM